MIYLVAICTIDPRFPVDEFDRNNVIWLDPLASGRDTMWTHLLQWPTAGVLRTVQAALEMECASPDNVFAWQAAPPGTLAATAMNKP